MIYIIFKDILLYFPRTNYNILLFSSLVIVIFLKVIIKSILFISVPSPPQRLTVRQMIGRRVQILWDPPKDPRGVITHYTIYYVPPLPPMEKTVLAGSANKTVSVFLDGYFKPNKNYSFWVSL